MRTKNRPLEIASGVIGTVFALAHFVPAIELIWDMATGGGLELSPSLGPAGLIILFFYTAVTFIAIAGIVTFIVAGVCYLFAAMATLFIKNSTAKLVFAILTCIFLSIEILVDCTFIFGTIVHGFEDGNYLSAIVSTLLFLTAITWFALNIALSRVHRLHKKTN